MDNIKMQLTEFCQKCQGAQNIKGIAVTTKEKATDEETKSIVTVSYYCDNCHTFVRSDEHEMDVSSARPEKSTAHGPASLIESFGEK